MSDRSQAQRDAEKRNDIKRKDSARLPGVRITDKESAQMNKLYKLFASKKEAILTITEEYLRNVKKNK